MRPVFNLKELNQFLHWEHFKMENIQTIRDLIQEGVQVDHGLPVSSHEVCYFEALSSKRTDEVTF